MKWKQYRLFVFFVVVVFCNGATVKRHIWTRISPGGRRWRAAAPLTLAFMVHLFAVDVRGVQVPLSLC